MAGHVVVGVDGSPGGRAALERARTEAKMRGTLLVAVTAFEPPTFYPIDALDGSYARQKKEAEEGARQAQTEALAEAGIDVDGEQVESRLREGTAASVLVAEGADADLLVVGSRGRGGFAGLLLGSVSQSVVQHSDVPVLVVPHTA